MPVHRFAVDVMLGRLAKWLRLIGHDASYDNQRTGRALLRHCRLEGRVLLTRNRQLLHRAPDVPGLLVGSDSFREQLRQVVDAFGLTVAAEPLARCTRCNVVVQHVDKYEVARDVPPYVFVTQQWFGRCPSCRRVYWAATHHERIWMELVRLGLARA